MWRKSIKNQLLIAFVVIALIPISIISQFIYTSVQDSHINHVLDNLSRVADKKVEQINTYTLEKQTDTRLLAASPSIASDIEQLQTAFYQHGIKSKQYQKIANRIHPAYQNLVSIASYYDVFLISNQGDIVFTIKHEADFGTNLLTGIYKKTELAQVFIKASKLLKVSFSSYRYYAPSNEDAAFVAAPVVRENRLVGVVALQLNSKVFQQVVQDNMGLGNTAETLVARKEGSYGYFVFPLKFKSAQIINNWINLNANLSLPILKALKGENSANTSIDYKGHQVVASWRYIPSFRVGMVIKIDIEEALADFNKTQWLQSFFVLCIFICITLIGIYLRRLLIDPIEAMLLASKKIAKGDINQRVLIHGNNEISKLSEAFNLMVDQLQKDQNALEKKVNERTANLQKAIFLLDMEVKEREKISAELQKTLAFKRALLDSNNFCIISTQIDGTILTFNAAAEKMLGYKAEELINKLTPAIFHDADEVVVRAKVLGQQLGRVIEPGFEVFVAKTDLGADENEWTYIRKDGGRFPVWLSVTAVLNENREKIGYLGIAFDISERKQMMDELQLAYNAIEHISEGIVITNAEKIITSINPAYTRIMGYTREEVVGKNPGFSKSGRHDSYFYQAMWNQVQTVGYWEGEIWDRRKDGSVFPKWLSISVIKDSKGEVAHYVGIFMDISQQKATEEKLEQLAFYDPLTQLPNRALFRDRLTQELLLAERNQHQSAVFFIDLDRFKWVNDNLGHDVGDELLIAVAARIKAQLRQTDSVCRLGGDEFTVILAEVADNQKISSIAQSIIDSLQAVFELKGHQVFIGASIGIAVFPEHGKDFSTLVKHADIAMYEAKNAGRGTYRFYQSAS
jgi:diguanylate cyclase (GGDEF)-like protein/PAS domain S-box-containing protein